MSASRNECIFVPVHHPERPRTSSQVSHVMKSEQKTSDASRTNVKTSSATTGAGVAAASTTTSSTSDNTMPETSASRNSTGQMQIDDHPQRQTPETTLSSPPTSDPNGSSATPQEEAKQSQEAMTRTDSASSMSSSYSSGYTSSSSPLITNSPVNYSTDSSVASRQQAAATKSPQNDKLRVSQLPPPPVAITQPQQHQQQSAYYVNPYMRNNNNIKIAAINPPLPLASPHAGVIHPHPLLQPPEEELSSEAKQKTETSATSKTDAAMEEGTTTTTSSSNSNFEMMKQKRKDQLEQADSKAQQQEEEANQSLSQPLQFSGQKQLEKEAENDVEAEILSERNKRILLARLEDAAPKGRLSLINLARRNLGPQEARMLTGALKANKFLSVLKLSYNDLGDEGAKVIADALFENGSHHPTLSVLDLGFNGIGDEGCEALAVKVVAGNFHLRTLYLSGNCIRDKGAMSIAGAILHGTGVSVLHISANTIGSMGLKTIAGAIAKNDARVGLTTGSDNAALVGRRVEELQLGSIGLDADGFIAIPGMLLSNTSLTHLCLSNNNIEDKDLMLLSQALSQNKQVPLRSLRLSFNYITCQGVESLMNSVWGSPTLRDIALDNNKIQDRGAQLCAVVLTSIELETLDLAFNQVTTVGIKALMKNLSENTSLKSLSLCGIPIDQNASKAISYALAYNISLRCLHVDNCSTGYSSQRHIVAGIVSNRRSSLRILTGFPIGPVAMTLGMPNLPQKWCNDQVLGFFRLMWDQWMLKSGRGSFNDEESRGPAPPAAVAAAAKIALSSVGANPDNHFITEQHERTIAESAPVDPGDSALLERTDSGTLKVPEFASALVVHLEDFHRRETMTADSAPSSPSRMASNRGTFENPERRNRNLQWLRQHFRALTEIGRLPFNNADLWQLHQYYFSPPFSPNGENSNEREDEAETDQSSTIAPPPTPALTSRNNAGLGRAVSFQTLGDAFAASGMMHAGPNKRRSDGDVGNKEGPAAKRAKSLSKPRVAYYPKIMNKIQSLGTKPVDQSLSLLRQLKYTENIMFAGRDPYSDEPSSNPDAPIHADVEMILLDLL